MQKIIAAAVVAIAIGVLSACATPVDDSSTAAGETATSTTAAGETNDDAATSTKTKAPAAPKYSVAQQGAIRSAESYLDMSGFSRAGLIGQLSSKSGDQYTRALATYAANHVGL